MRFSTLLGKTLRQAPAEAETASHRLLVRAGCVHALAPGLFAYLPLGQRARRHIIAAAREEFAREEAQELQLPATRLAEDNDRAAETAGREQLAERDALEVMVSAIRSYRELPALACWCATARRAEVRTRSGLLFAREYDRFVCLGAETDATSATRLLERLIAACTRLFARCGLDTLAVCARPDPNHPARAFFLPVDEGDDAILRCAACHDAAIAEVAAFRKPPAPSRGETPLPPEEVATLGVRTIDALAAFLAIPPARTLKAVFMQADGQPVFVAVRGDMTVSEAKLRHALHAAEVRPLDEDAVHALGLVAGSAGPVGLTGLPIVADDALLDAPNLVTGANRPDTHLRNVTYGRDWTASVVADIARARAGDGCPRCGAPLVGQSGILLGEVAPHNDDSEAPSIRFLDRDGSERTAVLASCTIDLTRLLAAIAASHHDDHGLAWPAAIAPLPVHLVALNLNEPTVREAAETLYRHLREAGLEPLYDDRDVSAGVKFADADLIGLPVRVTISPRSLAAGAVELRRRHDGTTEHIPLDEAVQRLHILCGAGGPPRPAP